MKFKEVILEQIDTLDANIDAVKVSMEKHTISPEQVYEAFKKVQYEMGRIRTLINRE